MPFPHTEKFAREFIETGGFSERLRDMIYQEATEEIVKRVRDAKDVYDLKLMVLWGGFLVYPAVCDLGNSRFSDAIDGGDVGIYDWFYELIEALQKDGVDLSHLWQVTDDQISWKFARSKTLTFTKDPEECSLSVNGKLLYSGKRSKSLKKLLQDYWCPVLVL